MKISREGLTTILLVNTLLLLLLISYFFSRHPAIPPLAILVLCVDVLVIYFFRDPERSIPSESGVIVSPADGRVVLIKEVDENQFIRARARQVSIFLSVFNVHVNRIPMSGLISHLAYVPGQFLAAFREDASLRNEQTVIGIEANGVRIVFKQIAGLLARRIICNLKLDSHVNRGDRFGIIKFGSRVDIFLPLSVELAVNIGDKVNGGDTIIGRIKS